MVAKRRALLAASASAAAAHKAPGAAYTTLTTLFTTLKKEAKDLFDIKVPELEEHNADCKEAIDTMAEEIAKQTKLKTEAETAEADAEKAIEAAEAAKLKEEQLKDAAETSKANAVLTYDKTTARMGYDLKQLQDATSGLDDALGKIKADATLADSTKSKLQHTMSQLKDKMTEDQKKLSDEIELGKDFHAEAQKTLQEQIDAHAGVISELVITVDTENGKLTAAKKAKAEAISNINAEKASKRAKTAACAEKKAALEAEIKDADDRMKALSAALDILGEPAAAAELLQAEKVIMLQQKPATGFLQLRNSPKKPVLDLLATMSSSCKAADLLRLALDQKPGAAEAFSKIASEIDTLSNTMYEQQEEDQKSKTWCQQKENELTLRIQDLTKTKEELELAVESLGNTAASHKIKAEKATSDINAATKQNVNDHKKLVEDLDANKVEQEQLKEDFGNLEQAKIALTNVFKGRTESGGHIVLDEVDKVIGQYEVAMTEAGRAEKEIQASMENTEDDHKTNIARLSTIEKRNKLGLKDNTAKQLSKSDALRVTNSDLKVTQGTMVKVVTGEEAKCLNWKEMYTSRMADRKAEIDNLKSAKEALSEYMTSLGLKMTM
ncbi:unnamed protein product [Amoebophrya sp. A25]|nr:unnamed protein product [Amoebophrya sp. A25]|eukprot:GSA25T00015833001.1